MRCVICENEHKESDAPMADIGNGKRICRACLKNAQIMAEFIFNHAEIVGGTGNVNMKPVADNNACMINGKMTPHLIKEALDMYVVGQEDAKITLSIASYNHMKRIAMGDPEIQKSNILLLGPTGCGKTHLVKTLGKILNVPVSITPATSLTEAGYIGNDAESVVANLFYAAGQNVERTEHGIIFIDEIDKLVSGRSGARKEVGGTGVQQALLPIIEGAKVEVRLSGKNKPQYTQSETVYIDTTNILFICGGAFPALEDIIKSRTTNHTKVGFAAPGDDSDRTVVDDGQLMRLTTTEDLQEFGLIPEFIGRIPVRTALDSLDIETLRKILTEPKDSIVNQYRKMFAYDGVDLVFEDHALDLLAKKASACGTGARALRGVVEEVLKSVMYDAPSDEALERICITGEYVKGEVEQPSFSYRPKQGVYFAGQRC